MMRAPVQAISGNLMWTRSGHVWALYRLHPMSYGFRRTKDKKRVRTMHRALIRALPGESLLLGTCAELDPAAIVERMIEGVDLNQCPDWAAECDATLDTLDEIGIGQRLYWLARPLGGSNPKEACTGSLRAAFSTVKDIAGLPRESVSRRELEHRQAQAQRVLDSLPAVFRPQAATAAQQVWLHLHSQQRGLYADHSVPEEPGDLPDQMLIRPGMSLPEPILDEGGQTDLEGKQLRAFNPINRRFLKVIGANEQESYQSLSVLTDVPDEGMVFPGSEYLGRIDESGIECDWAMRLTVRASDQVVKDNRKALRELNDQMGQREGELSHGMNMLDKVADDLAEYQAIFDSDKLEVETQHTIMFCTAASDADTAMRRSKDLTAYFADAGVTVQQPIGYQEELWWAMMPGAPTTRSAREFAQITSSRNLSTLVPLASTDLGDQKGSLLGLNISTGRPGAVLHDIAGASVRDVSGSLAVAGALGSGKSVLLKTLAGDAVDRGGQVVVPDRTSMGEWAMWAESVADSMIVDIATPTVSLDPLRLYGNGDVGSRVAQSFLTPLLNIAPSSKDGVLLHAVLRPSYLTEHGLAGLGDVASHLHAECTFEGAADLARLIDVFADSDFGTVIFDGSLPPLKATAPAIVIRTHTLELPKQEELHNAHLFEQMRLEKIFGRAAYALIGGIAKQICFANRSRLGLFVVDEAHHLTSSPEGETHLTEFVRDGRKHNGACALGSQDPEADFGSETLRGLIPTRIQMRQTDKILAKKGIQWLDMDPDDESLVEMLTSDTSPLGPNGVEEHRRGEAFMRDAAGNVGRIKVLAPSRPDRNEAVRTSPPEAVAASQGES